MIGHDKEVMHPEIRNADQEAPRNVHPLASLPAVSEAHDVAFPDAVSAPEDEQALT